MFCNRIKRIILSGLCLTACSLSVPAKGGEGLYTRIPFERDAAGQYVVTLKTPGGSARFLFDTGSPGVIVRRSFAQASGASCRDTGRYIYDYTNRRVAVETAMLDSLCVGEILFRHVQADVLPDSLDGWSRCQGYDGIIGGSILRNLVVAVDPREGWIVLTDDIGRLGRLGRKNSVRFVRAGGNGVVVPLRVSGGGRQGAHWACIDTGSSKYACRDDQFSALQQQGVWLGVQTARGLEADYGLVEADRLEKVYRRAVAGVLTLAGAKMENVPVESSFGGISTLGREVLEQGRMVIDYPRRRFYFIPYRQPAVFRPAFVNIRWRYDGGRIVVASVWGNVPEGVSPGDRIVSVDGKDCRRIGLCEYFRLSLREGTSIEVETAGGSLRTVIVRTQGIEDIFSGEKACF